MTTRPAPRVAAVGAVEQSNAMVLVTVAAGGGAAPDVLDRRRVVLTEGDLPTHPHHHEGSWAVGRYLATPGARRLSLAEAVSLVECVAASAARGAHAALDTLAGVVSLPIGTIAIRACPPMPATIDARITDHKAQTVADSVMYREALAAAAAARGWTVRWYDRATVAEEARALPGIDDLDAVLRGAARRLGPPWQSAHRLAAAAAFAALGRRGNPSAEARRCREEPAAGDARRRVGG